MNIEILSGSPRANSLTHRVALHLQKQLQQTTSHAVGLIAMKDNPTPPIQSPWKTINDTPEALKSAAEAVFNADAFILVSPEYNGGYSSALKNFLDHFPKQLHKTFGIATASNGALGGMRAAQQLLLLVPGHFGIASPQLLIVPTVETKFDDQGNLIEEKFAHSVHNFLSEFLWLAEKLHKS